MQLKSLCVMLVLVGIACELQLPLKGFPQQDMDDMGIDWSIYPFWHALWPSLVIDCTCMALGTVSESLGCRHTWRSHVPFGWSEPGHWLSEEFEIVDMVKLLPDMLTFEQFRTMQGYNVKPGSGLLAGLEGAGDIEEWRKSLYEYTFETPSTSVANLITPTALGIVSILVLSIKVFKRLIMPQFEILGRHLAVRAHGKEWLGTNQGRIVKFAEYVFRLCYHTFISIVGCYLFWNAPWWNEDLGGPRTLYTDWPIDPILPSMAWYYIMQAAYNADAMISLLQISFQVKVFPKDSKLPITVGWASTVRGDFEEMMAHHLVTNMLIFSSSYLKQTRIGSMVFLIHDISDVPVDLAKLANFVKWKNGTIFFFFLLCGTWCYTRLYILPCVVWMSIFWHGHEVGRGLEHLGVYFYAYQPFFISSLGALIVLHAIWFSMFLKMGYLLVTKGETHDLTEHKKGEKQNSLGKKANGASAATNGKTKVN